MIKYGNEKVAIEICNNKHTTFVNKGVDSPSKMLGVSLVYKFLEEIGEKVVQVKC